MAGTILTRETCRVCGEGRDAHPKPDHAFDVPPVGVSTNKKRRG